MSTFRGWLLRGISAKRILVTGANGFVAATLSARLAELGAEIHGISRRDQRSKSDPVQWHCGDLTDPQFVSEVFRSVAPDYVHHIAGYPYGSRDRALVMPALRDNTIATINVLDAACEANCEKVVLCGSMEEPGSRSADWIPRSPYAVSKFCATTYAKMFHKLYDLPVVTLRLFMIYGPGQEGSHLKKLIPYTILSLLKQEKPKIGNGARLVDWVYVEDVAEAIIAATLAQDVEGQVIDVGSGELVTIKEIVERLVEIVDPTIEPVFAENQQRPYESQEVADVETTSSVLGWSPKVGLDDGLRKTVSWYSAHLDRLVE